MQAQLAETLRQVAAPSAAMQAQLAETLRQVAAPFAAQAVSLGDALARALELFREIDPPNWPEGVSPLRMCELIASTGWSLTHVPRAEVIVELLNADSADRDEVLMARADDVVADCRACIHEISDPELGHLVSAIGQAFDAFDAGLPIPAQATVASVLGDIIGRTFGLTFASAVKEFSEEPGEMPLPYFRFWLIASTIPRALSRFHCERGDPVPDRFNRHAAVHTVDPRQYTRLNALVGLMLVTSLVRQLAEESAGTTRHESVAGDTG